MTRSGEVTTDGPCPTCGRVSSPAGSPEGGAGVETGVQTELRDARSSCAVCGAAMAEERVTEENNEVPESGETMGSTGSKPDGESQLGDGLRSDKDSSGDPGKTASRESGDLSSEIARLASIQQQLQQSPPPLAKQTSLPISLQQLPPGSLASLVCAAVQTECSQDQLTAELQELSERYDQLKTSCQALEEQKNELEEAENDARLMVQR